MGNFLVGLGIGITAGVLLAPRSGADTRRFLADKAAEGSDYVAEQGRQLKDTASDFYDRGRNIVNSQKEKISDMVSSVVGETKRQYQSAQRPV